jgi:DNA invertase Pin-like site-specific DNA recombinase
MTGAPLVRARINSRSNSASPPSKGRSRAKARGVNLGRKPKLTEHQKHEAIRRRDAGEPIRDIARTFNVSHSTISRLKNAV